MSFLKFSRGIRVHGKQIPNTNVKLWKDKCPPIDVLLLLSKCSIALYLNTGLAQNK